MNQLYPKDHIGVFYQDTHPYQKKAVYFNNKAGTYYLSFDGDCKFEKDYILFNEYPDLVLEEYVVGFYAKITADFIKINNTLYYKSKELILLPKKSLFVEVSKNHSIEIFKNYNAIPKNYLLCAQDKDSYFEDFKNEMVQLDEDTRQLALKNYNNNE